MNAHSIDRKTFHLTDNNHVLGELKYENLIFLHAAIELPGSDIFEISPVGFFQSSINVTQSQKDIASLKMNWRGEIAISYRDGREYVLKLNQFFFGKYIMENSNKEIIIQLDPAFNWRNFHYNYDISYNITDDKNARDTLLLLLGVYAANYFVACMSGANAGMM